MKASRSFFVKKYIVIALIVPALVMVMGVLGTHTQAAQWDSRTVAAYAYATILAISALRLDIAAAFGKSR